MSLRDQIAAELNGSEYPLQLSNGLLERAKAGRILIVYGASDDLMEFDGVFQDEVGAYEGGEAHIDAAGVLDRQQVDDDADDEIADYVARMKTARKIEALWGEDGYAFTFRTDIPHTTFEVVEDGEKYCRGIVIDLADLATPAAATEAETFWSIDEETFNHDSLEEAIEAILDNDDAPVGRTVWRGMGCRPDAAQFFDADQVIDYASERAGDEFGEWSDDFPHVTKEAKAELDDLLAAWARKHCEVRFYRIKDIEPYVITAADMPSTD